ncbi:LamG domain-containing protein [Pseudomonas fulva]|uniref:LamG domain-containing protein n=1 Tax=Pseudomonas fulva TaxID=47880 RepID=UPI003D2F0A81
MASYDASSMDVTGTTLTKWRNKQGMLGSAADLTPAKPQFPITVSQGAAYFTGRDKETYLDTAAFASALSVDKATFIARIRFGGDSDQVANTVFSSNNVNTFTFLRRNNGTRLMTGGSSPGPYLDSQIAPANSEWVFLAMVLDKGIVRIYLNDSFEQGSTAAGGSLPSLRLGANNSGANRLVGDISHFRVYNRAIGADELKEIRASL